jgi:hypothetical protein
VVKLDIYRDDNLLHSCENELHFEMHFWSWVDHVKGSKYKYVFSGNGINKTYVGYWQKRGVFGGYFLGFFEKMWKKTGGVIFLYGLLYMLCGIYDGICYRWMKVSYVYWGG